MQIYWKSAGNIPIFIMGGAGIVGFLAVILCVCVFRRKYYLRRTKSLRKSMRKASRASMGASVSNMGSVYNMGLSQVGMNPMGMSQMGMNSIGMPDGGMNPMMMSQMNMSQMGISAAPSFAMPPDVMDNEEGTMNQSGSRYGGSRSNSFANSFARDGSRRQISFS